MKDGKCNYKTVCCLVVSYCIHSSSGNVHIVIIEIKNFISRNFDKGCSLIRCDLMQVWLSY
jgi:hypothetical protein